MKKQYYPRLGSCFQFEGEEQCLKPDCHDDEQVIAVYRPSFLPDRLGKDDRQK